MTCDEDGERISDDRVALETLYIKQGLLVMKDLLLDIRPVGPPAASGGSLEDGNDGHAWHCSVGHSNSGSACSRSIQTPARRMKKVNTLHVSPTHPQ
jgi:hypothetical protein